LEVWIVGAIAIWRGGDRTDIFLSDRTIYLEGDRASKGGSSGVEGNILRVEGGDRKPNFQIARRPVQY